MHEKITKPKAEDLTGYMQGYVNEVNDDDLLNALHTSLDKAMNLYLSIENEVENYRYAEGKWTIKEVLSHVVDTERIFCYRALTIARNDKTPMPGFDENEYVPNSNAANRNLTEVINEYELVRKGTIALFESFNDEMLDRKGTANYLSISPRIIGYMLAGHDIHHIDVIRQKYLTPVTS